MSAADRIRKVTVERLSVDGKRVVHQVIWEVDCVDGSILACSTKVEAVQNAKIEERQFSLTTTGE